MHPQHPLPGRYGGPSYPGGMPPEAYHHADGRGSPTGSAMDLGDGTEGSSGKETTRKPWLEREDQAILESVRAMGFRWRVIAGMLPGRSDDAVRNRWNRLQEAIRDGSTRLLHGGSGVEKAKAGYKCSKCGQPKRNHVCTYQPGTPLASAAAQGKNGGKQGGSGPSGYSRVYNQRVRG